MDTDQSTHSPLQTRTNSWRVALKVFLVFILLYAAVWIVRVIMGVIPNLLMRQLGASPNFRAYVGGTLNYGVGIASYLIFPAIALRKVLNVDPWTTLFPIQRNWWKDILFGLALVASVLFLFFVVEVNFGGLIVDSWNWQTLSPDTFLRIAWVGLLVNIGVAIGEEAIFRGYLLTGLKSVFGKWAGLAVMVVIFGLFHLPAYIATGMQSATLMLAIFLATLFGALFGLVYLRTQSLWLPVSLHFSWNFVENDLLNLTADSSNQNLIGAMTRLQGPLTMADISFGNVVVIEILAFGLIAFGVWVWMRFKHPNEDLQ